MLKSIKKQSRESVESVLKKKRKDKLLLCRSFPLSRMFSSEPTKPNSRPIRALKTVLYKWTHLAILGRIFSTE